MSWIQTCAGVPDPALVVLVGPSGSGKSAWAAARYLPREIVSSDQLRAVVGSGEHDLDASADAFALLDQIVAARARRRLTTVVDTLGLDAGRRLAYLELAQAGRAAGRGGAVRHRSGALPAAQPRLATRPVPAAVLDAQLRRMPDVAGSAGRRGLGCLIVQVRRAAAVEPAHSPGSRRAASQQRDRPAQLEFILQISRFGWDDDPAGWLQIGGARRRRGGIRGHRADGSSDSDPAGRPGLGTDPRALGNARLAGRPGHRAAARHAGQPGHLPRSRRAGQDGGHAGRAQRRTGVLRHRGRLVGTRARRLRAAVPAGRRAARHAGGRASRHCARCGSPAPRPTAASACSLPETTCYPRPVSSIPVIVGGSGERTLRIAARLADGCNLPSDLAVLDDKLAVLRDALRAGRPGSG